MRVRLTRGLVIADDVFVFLPAGASGTVSDITAEGVEVDFDAAVITGDGDGVRTVQWTAAVAPDLLRNEPPGVRERGVSRGLRRFDGVAR